VALTIKSERWCECRLNPETFRPSLCGDVATSLCHDCGLALCDLHAIFCDRCSNVSCGRCDHICRVDAVVGAA
jgi:predicted sulfurtransferase